MNFTGKLFSNAVLGATAALSIFIIGCGGGSSSQKCCQTKLGSSTKTLSIPEVKGDQIVYVDRNVTVIEYVDRNVTIIEYLDRNVTVDVIKVRPDAKIVGLKDDATLEGDFLPVDGATSSDKDGDVVSYRWLLDDQEISRDIKTVVDLRAKEVGDHKLCLEVIDNDKLSSEMTCKTFVIPAPPVPNVEKDPIPTITLGLDPKDIKTKCPLAVSGADSFVDEGANITEYLWTIDKKTLLHGKDQNLSFDTLGSHEICLEVTDSRDKKVERCKTIEVKKHDTPTPKLTIKDGDTVLEPPFKLTKGQKYDFTCEGSKDDCGNSEPMKCEWSAFSYNTSKSDKYVADCIDHNKAPREGKDSWVRLCHSGTYDYINIELTITDQFGGVSKLSKDYPVGQ